MIFKCLTILKYGICGTVLVEIPNDEFAELLCPKCGSYYTKDYLVDESEIDEEADPQ